MKTNKPVTQNVTDIIKGCRAPTDDDIDELVNHCLNLLSEFTDAVQIMVSWQNAKGNTPYIMRGKGSTLARERLAELWLRGQDEFPEYPEEEERVS